MNIKFLALVCFVFTVARSIAQDIPEPDFSQKPYYLKDAALQEFEKVDSPMSIKIKGMGYGGFEISFSAAGLMSPIRFAANVTPVIIVKMEDNRDPSEVFTLLMGDIRKDRRRFVTGKIGAFFGNSKSNNQKEITISAKKLRDKVFQITFEGSLQPGEYAIIPDQKHISMETGSQMIKISCFGVD